MKAMEEDGLKVDTLRILNEFTLDHITDRYPGVHDNDYDI